MTFVLLHLGILRYYYIPLFFGILPWNINLGGDQKITVHGLEKTPARARQLETAFQTLPDAVFDTKNPETLKQVFFHPWLPDSWMHTGGSRFTRTPIIS